jgi:hypothetical protein
MTKWPACQKDVSLAFTESEVVRRRRNRAVFTARQTDTRFRVSRNMKVGMSSDEDALGKLCAGCR